MTGSAPGQSRAAYASDRDVACDRRDDARSHTSGAGADAAEAHDRDRRGGVVAERLDLAQ